MSTKRDKPGKIEYGNVSFPDSDFTPKATRIRISIMVRGDVLDRLREMAEDEGIAYQTLINKILHEATQKGSTTERLEKLEKVVAGLRAGRRG